MDLNWIFFIVLVSESCWAEENYGTTPSYSNYTSEQEFLDWHFESTKYDKRVRPFFHEKIPTVVDVDIYVNDISSMDEVKMEYELDIFLRQRWQDPRLAYSRYNYTLTLDFSRTGMLWIPDLFFSNEKTARFHDVTVPNRYVRLWPNGQLLFSQRLTLILTCSMKLQKFPLDNQTCRIRMESYGFTTKDVIFRWRPEIKEPLHYSDTVELPEFIITGTKVGDCTATYNTGTFTCLYGNIFFKRELWYYLIQTYIPSVLIVILSWVSFWIDMDAVPARITLGLLTVLTMTTQHTGISARLPRVSYIKAIDVWMSTCLVFVFAALLEYSIVNVTARREANLARRMRSQQNLSVASEIYSLSRLLLGPYQTQSNKNISQNTSGKESDQSTQESTTSSRATLQSDTGPTTLADAQNESLSCSFRLKSWAEKYTDNRALMVDIVSRVLFPVTFIIFNILYWTCYIYVMTGV